MKKILPILFLFFAFISNAQTVSITSSAPGSICAGTSVTFTATPSGYTTPSYQWYKNNVAISGATNSTYSSSSLSNNDVIKVAVVEGGASVSTTGLVLNLDAGNSSSYSGTGNTWTDLTGRGNNGAITNGITYNAANGGYFQFPNSGSVGGIVLPASSNDFNFTTSDFAVELWVNAYNNQARLISLNTKSDVTSTALTIFPVGDTPLSIYAGSLSTTGFIWSVWHQVVYTRISGTVSLYIDGVLKATATDASNLPSNSATTSNTLGSFVATSGYLSYTGKMSIARVYKTAGLTTTQVVSNYNSICSRYGLSAIGTSSNSITTSVTAGPTAPSITVVGDGCINKSTLSTPTGLSSYTWLKDNVAISGATTTTYSPTESGNYKVAVSNGTCSTASAATTIYTCGVTADGKMISTTFSAPLVSSEGGTNFGTTIDEVGKILNTTGLTTTTGIIAATTAVLGGVISPTNAISSSIGVVYSTDANFGTSSSSTIQSNVVAGTYTTTITGLTAVTNYYAKSFITNKAGTSYGPVVSFTTASPPVSVGDVYQGGIVFYVLQPGDIGYDANAQHGLIAPFNNTSRRSTNPLPPIIESQIGKSAATISGAQFDGLLVGKTNTDAIILNQGSTGTYAALYCRNYTNPIFKTFNSVTYTFPVYTDWYMPSIVEINKFRAYLWSAHPSRGTYFNYGNNLIYYRGTSGNDNDYAWGKMLSSTMIGDRYKLYYVESGNEDGSTAYNGWSETDRLVVMPIRSF